MDSLQRTEHHRKLIEFAEHAVRQEQCKGLCRFMSKIKLESTRNQMLMWIKKFTPIVCVGPQIDKPQKIHFTVDKRLFQNFDLGPARLNPYYSLDVASELKSHPVDKAKAFPRALRQSPLSDKEFEEKTLRSALNRFLDEPSLENRAKMSALLDAYMHRGSAIRHSPFLQAGAPGLGKRH